MSKGLGTEASARHWRELSAYCAAAMSRMSFSHGVVVTGAGGAPHAAPFGRRETEASFPAGCHEELLDEVLNHGLSWSRCLVVS
jgi:hypothetical protein